ncbi:MAG TPA: chemotaxis protein CheW [Thermoanaerobaculia bacterium]|nr:chemotaxis protein CheW [Thermoanaerobaculia bacterium]
MATPTQARLIGFRVGTELYALDLMSVRQVAGYTGSTTVATAPAFVEGIILLRSEVVPLIDLRRRLYPDLPPAERSLLVITETEGRPLALKVDEILRVLSVEVDSLLPAPELIRQSERGSVLIGIVPYGDEVAMLLDVDALLTREEKQLLADAALES